MITLDIRGMEQVQRQLRDLAEKQIPYATMLALNNTAFALRKVSQERLQAAFDRPTPLITGATRVEKATKETLTAKVMIDPKRRAVLTIQEIGGQRGQKGFEKALGLPTDWRAVPTKNMPLNTYGNPDKAINSRIRKARQGAGKGKLEFFFIDPAKSGYDVLYGRLSPGVYMSMRGSREIVKLYHYVRRTIYDPILKWEPTMKTEAEKLLPSAMEKAIEHILSTAG